MTLRPALILAALAVSATTALAADAVRTERIQFPPGATATSVRGSVKGYDSVRYLVGVRAGQTLSVGLKTDNTSNYFNIVAPGADQAMFIGPTSGHAFQGKVLTGGDYTVQVYLMRNAARRGETANYTLGVGATG